MKWARIPGASGGSCGAEHNHASGYRVIHCGHPTALRPYYIESPDGKTILAPNGLAFPRLAEAKAAVEKLTA